MKPLPSPPLPVELLASSDQRRTTPGRRPGYIEAEQFNFPFIAGRTAPVSSDPHGRDIAEHNREGQR